MALAAGPGAQVHPEGRIASGDGDPAADRHLAQRPADEEMGAPLETQEAEIERGTRAMPVGHGSYSRAVTVPVTS
ncbi:hypothetical protein GCM10009608_48130 [Pseudonocardia alaniniphila]